MICDRCGRNNPENLAFCQDCGRRLASPAGLVPPTPPVGLGVVSLPGDYGAEAGLGGRSRPEAPAFSFESREEEGPTCTVCSTRNPVANRFCVSCGSRLPAPGPAVTQAGGPTAAMPPHPVAVATLGAAPIAAARIVCGRCNGASDATMLYCQFCGASLRPHDRAGGSDPAPARAPALADGVDPYHGGVHGGVQEKVTARSGPMGDVSGRLVTIARDGAEGTSYPLAGEQLDIGREDGNILLREDAYVSPRHLRLARREEGWYAKDLGSVNGIYLRLRRAHALVDGDLLLIGLQVLRFEAVRDAEQGFGPATQHGTLLFGSPMLPRYARFCERTVEGVTRNVFYLHRDETIIGRESGDVVFTDDPFMSRRHVSIRLDGATATFTATDLGSSNGTYVAVRGETPLTHGDFLRVGQHLFRVDLVASHPPPAGGSPIGGIRRGP
ncbi:MAG TPA: FHA domain-containing protein [Polyangiaceae bacterium]|nr:FHA domain-containing protein [Polyangiaceae bacterium]